MSTSKVKGDKGRPESLAAVHKTVLKSLLGGDDPGYRSGGTSIPRFSFPLSSNTSSISGTSRPNNANKRPSSSSIDQEVDVASLQRELDSLKRRKALLAGEVEQLRHGVLHDCKGGYTRSEDGRNGENNAVPICAGTCTVADELEYVRTRADHALGVRSTAAVSISDAYVGTAAGVSSKWANRQYLHKYDDRDGIGLVISSSNSSTITNISKCKRRRSMDGDVDSAISAAINAAREERAARTIAEQLHDLRTQRRIAAAHRLAGVSVMPFRKEPDAGGILGIRFDICLGGEFVARYYVFFDIALIRSNGDQQHPPNDVDESSIQCSTAFLRVAQHTLPTPGVPVQPILEKNFGPDGALAFDITDASCKEVILYQVRQCVGEIHDSCHAFATRREACRYLRERESNHHGRSVNIHNIGHNDGFDRISFDVCLSTGTSKDTSSEAAVPICDFNLTIQLCYDKYWIARPTSMGIKHDGNDMAHLDMTDTVEDIKKALFSYPIPVVLEEKIEPILRCAFIPTCTNS